MFANFGIEKSAFHVGKDESPMGSMASGIVQGLFKSRPFKERALRRVQHNHEQKKTQR